jgi:nucleotide-binding universal stress UspA family protein
VAVQFLQARHRRNIEGNNKPARSGLVIRKFPAGSIPRWRAYYLYVFLITSEGVERNESTEMKILIAYDGSDFAAAILDDLRYAGLPPRAEVEVITLAEPEHFQVSKKTERVVEWLSYKLIEARSAARLARDRIRADFPGWDVTFEARLAPPPQEIVRKVMEWNPDLVITGQHGRAGSKRAGLGRVAKRLFKEANCSLRIARAHIRQHDAPPRIIIPLSASQNLEATARVVMSRLWPPRTEVMLIASIGPILSEMQLACGILDSQVEAIMETWWQVERKLQLANLLVTSEIRAGFSTTDVIETARRWSADCVFIGVEKMSFFERMFCGDIVSSVAARAECSVEVVRGPVRCDVANSEFTAGVQRKYSLPVAS